MKKSQKCQFGHMQNDFGPPFSQSRLAKGTLKPKTCCSMSIGKMV
jgi:hypothetical protein